MEKGHCTLGLPVDGGLVVGLAAVGPRDLVHGDGTAVGVGVEEEQWLEVTFDALSDHVLPPGADLTRRVKTQQA